MGLIDKDNQEDKTFIESINERFWDLMVIFQKRVVYHPEQKSSYSLKYVAPAWLEDENLDYSSLGVSNGSEAYISYLKWLRGEIKDEKKLFSDLREYCKYDTLNPLLVIRKLQTLVDLEPLKI